MFMFSTFNLHAHPVFVRTGWTKNIQGKYMGGGDYANYIFIPREQITLYAPDCIKRRLFEQNAILIYT